MNKRLERKDTIHNNAKTMLFIDDIVPLPQLGRGYPRSFFLLNSFLAMGYRITFFPMLDALRCPQFQGMIRQDQYEANIAYFQQQGLEKAPTVFSSRPPPPLLIQVTHRGCQAFRAVNKQYSTCRVEGL